MLPDSFKSELSLQGSLLGLSEGNGKFWGGLKSEAKLLVRPAFI